jgi:hypothetical protein
MAPLANTRAAGGRVSTRAAPRRSARIADTIVALDISGDKNV